MKIISVNIGQPRTVDWKGRSVTTAFFKEPVKGGVRVRELGLEGDKQADLRVHGGLKQAVYAYPSEHYDYWKRELPGVELPWGSFGENLTTHGLLENKVRIGDTFRVGSTELTVIKPRLPCFKMNVRFQRDDMMNRYQKAGRSGFYLAVSSEGVVQTGDEIRLVANGTNNPTVVEVFESKLAKEQE